MILPDPPGPGPSEPLKPGKDWPCKTTPVLTWTRNFAGMSQKAPMNRKPSYARLRVFLSGLVLGVLLTIFLSAYLTSVLDPN